eukprot:5376423-Pleurochrysis_carterae.AAC.2
MLADRGGSRGQQGVPGGRPLLWWPRWPLRSPPRTTRGRPSLAFSTTTKWLPGRSLRSAGSASQWTCGSASTSGRAEQRGAVVPVKTGTPVVGRATGGS